MGWTSHRTRRHGRDWRRARDAAVWLALLIATAACGTTPVASTATQDRPAANRNTTGELKPPQIGDEQAVKRPPAEASNQPMPVIPPPGTPGGDPKLQPK